MPKAEKDIGIDSYILELTKPLTPIAVRIMLARHPEIGKVSLKYVRERRRILSGQQGGAEQDRDSGQPAQETEQKSPEHGYIISPSGRRMLDPMVYEIIKKHRKEPTDVTLKALEELGLEITRSYLGLLRNRVDYGKVPKISPNALEFSRPPSAARKSAKRIDQERGGLPRRPGYIYFGRRKVLDPAVYEVIGDHRGDTIEETRRALKARFGMDISAGHVSVLRTVVDRGEIPKAATSGILEGRKGARAEGKAENEKGYGRERDPRIYGVVDYLREMPIDDSIAALKKELGIELGQKSIGVIRHLLKTGKRSAGTVEAMDMKRILREKGYATELLEPRRESEVKVDRRERDPRIYGVVDLLKGRPVGETLDALRRELEIDMTPAAVYIVRSQLSSGKRSAKIPEAQAIQKELREKGYLQKAESVEPPEVAPAEAAPPAKIPPPFSLPKKESAPPRDENWWREDPRRRKGIYDFVARYRAADPESLPRLIFDRFGVELNVYQIGWIKREIREKEEGKQLPSPDHLRFGSKPEDGEKITLETMTDAIRNSVGKRNPMEEEGARALASHVMNFFGYSDRMLDNVLEPEDRDLFYNLEDAGILTTEREETTLYDGREWRIHYWLFRKDRIAELVKGLKEEKEEVIKTYTGEGSADMWAEAMLDRKSANTVAATPAYENGGAAADGAVAVGPMRPGLVSGSMPRTYKGS